MLEVIATSITVDDLVIPVFANSNKEYFFSTQSLEYITQSADRSIRDFLASKSPEALRCNGLTSGKNAKIIGEKTTVKLEPLVVVENYLLFKSLRGNANAIKLLGWFSGLGLHTVVATAFGETVTKVDVDAFNQLRKRIEKQFHPLFTSHCKADGCASGLDYIKRLSQFKCKAGLPGNLSVNDMNEEQLRMLDVAEIRYDIIRRMGFNHQDALNKL